MRLIINFFRKNKKVVEKINDPVAITNAYIKAFNADVKGDVIND